MPAQLFSSMLESVRTAKKEAHGELLAALLETVSKYGTEELVDAAMTVRAIHTTTTMDPFTIPMVFEAIRARMVKVTETCRAGGPYDSLPPQIDWIPVARRFNAALGKSIFPQ